MALFLVAIILGYVITAAITGYRYEMLLGKDMTTDLPIADAKAHFTGSYIAFLNIAGMVQLATGILGIVTLVLWFGWNIIGNARARKRREK